MSLYEKIKKNYDELRNSKREEWNIKKASQLQKLRSERIKEEGRARLLKKEEKERFRIAKAKNYNNERANPGLKKALSIIKDIKKGLKNDRSKDALSLKTKDVYNFKK